MTINKIKTFLYAQFTKSPRTVLSQLTRTRTETSIETLIEKNKEHFNQKQTLSIDLGSNVNVRNPFKAMEYKGIDIHKISDSNGIIECDLFNQKIPINDSTVTSVTAYDFIEHVPRVVINNGLTQFKFIELMNEIHRILKPRGVFLSVTPAYPYKEAFMDPTHVNIITEDTFKNYFCSGLEGKDDCLARIYGFKGDFELIDQAWIRFRLVTIMCKKD
jgi:hypothetical protein